MRRCVFVALLLCSCTGTSVTEVPMRANHGETSRQASDGAVTVMTSVGDSFTLTLEANPTTGYQWQMDRPPDEKVARFVARDYRPAQPGMIGSGGVETWTFTSVGKGKTEISLHYVRPWEKDVPPVRKAVFPVIVQ